MTTGAEGLQGPRLEFVVRELPGTIERFTYRAPPTKRQRDADPSLEGNISNTKIKVLEPAGFMVYTPTGNCYRLSAEELMARGLDREPNIIGIEQANDTKTAAGRFKLARNDQARQRAWLDMEKEIINACMGRYGDVVSMIENYDPRRPMPAMKEAA